MVFSGSHPERDGRILLGRSLRANSCVFSRGNSGAAQGTTGFFDILLDGSSQISNPLCCPFASKQSPGRVLQLFAGGKRCQKEILGYKGFHGVVFAPYACFVADFVRSADGMPQPGNPLKLPDLSPGGQAIILG
jgi:hypothetical protein